MYGRSLPRRGSSRATYQQVYTLNHGCPLAEQPRAVVVLEPLGSPTLPSAAGVAKWREPPHACGEASWAATMPDLRDVFDGSQPSHFLSNTVRICSAQERQRRPSLQCLQDAPVSM